MAYAARQDGAQRTVTIGAVLFFHLVIGAMLVQLFTSHGFFPPPERWIEATFQPKPMDTPPPPTTEPTQSARPHETSGPTSDPTFQVPPTGPTTVVDTFEPLPTASGSGTELGNTGGVTPSLFTPTSPSPATSPSGWATTNDYPSMSLRLDERGTTKFRVTVGSDGAVKACEIVRSSGHKRLDDATCKLVSSRARFEPARDKYGETTVGTYSSSVRWVLPN